jgi:SAM-dependent methyltransferase
VDDSGYDDPQLAALYDLFNPWGPSDDFYLELIMAAESVLDVGCGTGMLLKRARAAGHAGRLVGLDPANAMLDIARERSDIEWIHGDLSTVGFDREFDLIYMTGHAFQVFLEDDQIRQTLTAVRDAMTENGRFAFETRNPAVRAWESWTPEHVYEISVPGQGTIRDWNDVQLPVDGDLVTFRSYASGPAVGGFKETVSTLRFLDAAGVARFLNEAGLIMEEQYGYWDRSPLTDDSPEIILIARRG